MWVSLFVSSPKMSKCDGKMEIFCWLTLTLHFPSHFCVQSTELHRNGASTKSVPCSRVRLCPISLSHLPGAAQYPHFHSPRHRERRKVWAHFTGWRVWIDIERSSCNKLADFYPAAELGKKHRVFWLSLRSCSASRMPFLGESQTQSSGAGGAGIQQQNYKFILV